MEKPQGNSRSSQNNLHHISRNYCCFIGALLLLHSLLLSHQQEELARIHETQLVSVHSLGWDFSFLVVLVKFNGKEFLK